MLFTPRSLATRQGAKSIPTILKQPNSSIQVLTRGSSPRIPAPCPHCELAIRPRSSHRIFRHFACSPLLLSRALLASPHISSGEVFPNDWILASALFYHGAKRAFFDLSPATPKTSSWAPKRSIMLPTTRCPRTCANHQGHRASGGKVPRYSHQLNQTFSRPSIAKTSRASHPGSTTLST